MNKKIFSTIVLTLISIVTFAVSAFAGDWVNEGVFWKYLEDDIPVVNDWRFIHYGNDYNYYFFDELGHMCVGLKKIGNETYMFDINGKALSNSTIKINGRDCRTKNKGLVVDLYSDANIDYNAWNAQYIAENTLTAEEKAAQAVAEQEAREKKAVEDAVAASLEKKGPKAAGQQKALDAYSGPGMAIGGAKKGAAMVIPSN